MACQMSEVAQYLLRSIYQMHKRCEVLNSEQSKKSPAIKPGIIKNLAGLEFLLQKIRKSDKQKSIGFFGAQKRGKSSLINWLLGCDLMPTGAMPMTSAIVSVTNDPNMEDNTFKIESETEDGRRIPHGERLSLVEAQNTLKEQVSHAGKSCSVVSHLWVTSNFSHSRILGKGGVLVDTPGAECAFEDGKKKGRRKKSEISSMSENEIDAKRALQALQQVKVVVFVERADYKQSKNSVDLYSNHVRNMRPICVVNFKDQYELDRKTEERIKRVARDEKEEFLSKKMEAEKISQLKMQMMNEFGAIIERTFCISCKETVSKFLESEDYSNGLEGWENGEAWKKENGIQDLENKIITEMGNLEADTGLKTCIDDLKQFLGQIKEDDPKKAKDVFSAGLVALCVFINKLQDEYDSILRKDVLSSVRELFDSYAPDDRRKYVEVCAHEE